MFDSIPSTTEQDMASSPLQIKNVAVIGAGISGVCSAAHLLRQGLNVTVFERSSIPGGVWHFDPRTAYEPPYPNERPSVGDYVTSEHGADAYVTPPPEEMDCDPEREIAHAPPGPCYAGLKNNVSTRQMKTTLADWPVGTEDFVSQRCLEEYIQNIAVATGVVDITQFRTRVEHVRKSGGVWMVRTTTLEKRGDEYYSSHGGGQWKVVERNRKFDAIVVASGHYNVPRIPDIAGLKEWKNSYPDHVLHSKGYRRPEEFRSKNVLLIGAGVSSCDIARELDGVANNTYQSSRGGHLDLPTSFLPSSATRVCGVERFDLETGDSVPPLEPEGLIRGFVRLRDGTKLAGIHSVIMCTGYMTSYPFLPHLHSDTVDFADADENVLVTADGTTAHNLHKDIFWLKDPTLAFVGVPYHISTFSLFELQAQVVARVFAGKAILPAYHVMRQEYVDRVAMKGLGRDFHSLRFTGQEVEYVADLVRWMNQDAARFEIEEMIGHTEEWKVAYAEQQEKLRWIRESRPREGNVV